jgi:SAM-dependent methyltransferase
MRHEEEQLHARILDRLGPVGEMLDVGCDSGGLVNFLAREEASRAAVAGLMECVHGAAKHMAVFEDGRFEAATMTYALHHIEHRDVALREILRALRPGGRLLIADYVIVEGRPSSECHRVTAAQLRRMVEDAGFLRVGIEMVGPSAVLLTGEQSRGGGQDRGSAR